MIFNMTLSEQGSLAELTNIRIGADGTNYPTAGDAVRGQVTDLKEDFTNKVDKGMETTQLPCTMVLGKYINSTGGESSVSGYAYIEADLTGVTGYLRILSKAGYGNARYAFYDSNDSPIEINTDAGAELVKLENVEIPTGAVTVKVSGKVNEGAPGVPKVCGVKHSDAITNSNGGIYTDLLVPNDYAEIDYSWANGAFVYNNNYYDGAATLKFMTLNVVEGEFYRITGDTYYSYNLIGLIKNNGTITWIPNASNRSHIDKVIQVPSDVRGIVVQGKADDVITIKKASSYVNGRIFLGKKIAIIGDSTVERNTNSDQKWHDNISLLTGVEVVNMGISGAGYKKGEGSNKAYYQRVANVPNDVDAVLIFGSGNDNDQTIGTVSDSTTSTVCGCVNKTINDLIALYPTIKIGIITAYPWQSFKPATTNAMQTIAEDIVQICKDNSIPVLDLYHCSNLRPWVADNNTALFFNADGVHINNAGHAIITPIILEFLKTLLLA